LAEKNKMELPINDAITSESSRESLKWFAALLLAVMLVGVTALAYWLPVKRYIVTCTKSQTISCELQRETSSEYQTWRGELGKNPIATVKIQTVRRGAARVFLYIDSETDNLFAAEFEGGGDVTQARSAAAKLNQFFSSEVTTPVRIVASPLRYLTRMLWGGVGFLSILVLVIYRELFNWKPSSR
jgi:hypothetical protein